MGLLEKGTTGTAMPRQRAVPTAREQQGAGAEWWGRVGGGEGAGWRRAGYRDIAGSLAFTPRGMGMLCKILSREGERSQLMFKRDSCVREESKNFVFQF